DPPSDSSDGNDLTSGLDASLDAHLPGGTYTVVLDGVGFGDPASTGYSDYARLGRYTLTVQIDNNGYNGGGGDTTDPEPTVPAAPSGFSVTAGTDGTATLGWSDNSNNELGFEIQREFLHRSGSFRGTTTWTVGIDKSSHVDSPGSGTFRYRIRAYNSVGYSTYAESSSPDGWVEVTVSGGGGGGGGGKPTKAK
ncbi:MAG TPA: fibronectin type III domain-containing protein, partial [Ilumatobacter sp.]|nr:fibronectin type III domain-containing protein [Ilumatobacter sp.]